MKTVIDSRKSSFLVGLREVFRYRDLFLILAYKDYRVRYAQTYLGFVWAFIQPALTLLIFSIVFGRAVKVDTGDVPYPLFALCGMSAWAYFAYVMSQAGNSIISVQGMINKIYFPRIVVPLAKAFIGLVELSVSLVFLTILMIIYGQNPSSNLIYLPAFILLNMLTAIGIGIWLSALTVKFRDFQHIVPFMVQFGLYATPVAYPADLVVDNLSPYLIVLYYCNPMAGVVEGFRYSIIEFGDLSYLALISFLIALALFISGVLYFNKAEKSMADIV